MTCVLVFVAFGQMFVPQGGSWMYQACYYKCDQDSVNWFDRVYHVSPSTVCPAVFGEA